MAESGFRVQVLGNVQACRSDAEVYRLGDGAAADLLAVVYESSDGWQIDFQQAEKPVSAELAAAILAAGQDRLKEYVNRRGENPSPGLSVAGLSFWLIEKADGSAMGVRIR